MLPLALLVGCPLWSPVVVVVPAGSTPEAVGMCEERAAGDGCHHDGAGHRGDGGAPAAATGRAGVHAVDTDPVGRESEALVGQQVTQVALQRVAV